jgi:hypothetical protein
MADPGYVPSTSWRSRLPGTPGGPQSPSYSTPEGLYQYIIDNVPGISQAGASWLHSRILGGQAFLNDPVNAQYPNLNTASGADQAVQGVTLAQLNQIAQLQPFMMGAPVNTYSGPPVAAAPPPAPAPPGPGNKAPGANLGPFSPAVTDTSAWGNPHVPHTPPNEDYPVPPPGARGWMPADPYALQPPVPVRHHPIEDYNPGPGPFGGLGPGASLAEQALAGVSSHAPSMAYLQPIDDRPSPVHYLRRRPSWLM